MTISGEAVRLDVGYKRVEIGASISGKMRASG